MADSDFRFHEEDNIAHFRGSSNDSGITGFFIRNSGGLIQNQQQANLVMIVLIVVSVVFAFVLMPEGEEENNTELVAPTGMTVEELDGGPPRVSN